MMSNFCDSMGRRCLSFRERADRQKEEVGEYFPFRGPRPLWAYMMSLARTSPRITIVA